MQLRRLEHDDNRSDALRGTEFREEQFPELQKVRTGRANLALIAGVRVDYYGTMTPLNQVASCSTPSRMKG